MNNPSGTQHAPRRTLPHLAVARRASPSRLATATPPWEGGDDGFEAALSRLACSVEGIRELRARAPELESLLQNAIDRQDFAAAARWRDELREVRSKDPEVLIASLSTQMQVAVEGERYNEAAQYRDKLRVLKQFLPEYQLAGLWNVSKGVFLLGQAAGDLGINISFIRIGYNGDTLTCAGSNGELVFDVDLSQPVNMDEADAPQVVLRPDGGTEQETYRMFRGEIVQEMNLSRVRFPGVMYMCNNETIAFWWSVGVDSSGRMQMQDEGASSASVLLAFGKVVGLNDDDDSYNARLDKLLKSDISANEQQ